ncbi:MAG: HPr kinase/phosphatase C-terminal domain-containing protein [Alphaproteobacteria bacterium]|nr:HPr kinase/phosphatase C-terminal domain-containing protein [Alphaproteobacteria bacterium]
MTEKIKKMTVHATCIAMENGKHVTGVLLRGTAGSGKSDTAFRLIETHGFKLVSDDQVIIQSRGDTLYASPAENIAGMMEVRGLGLLRYPLVFSAPLRLVVDLVPRENVPRLPDVLKTDFMEKTLPYVQLHGHDNSTPLKIIKMLEIDATPGLMVDCPP